MNDWESIPFRCGYEPCQHEWRESFHKHDLGKGATKKCPKCGVFNAKRSDISDMVKAAMESIGENK
jgi:hypothetical protein